VMAGALGLAYRMYCEKMYAEMTGTYELLYATGDVAQLVLERNGIASFSYRTSVNDVQIKCTGRWMRRANTIRVTGNNYTMGGTTHRAKRKSGNRSSSDNLQDSTLPVTKRAGFDLQFVAQSTKDVMVQEIVWPHHVAIEPGLILENVDTVEQP